MLTLQHLTLAHGRAHGTMMYAPAPAPCSQGYYDGYGGALYFRDGELVVIDTQFIANQAEQIGAEVGGGAISFRRQSHTNLTFEFRRAKGVIEGVINNDVEVRVSLSDALEMNFEGATIPTKDLANGEITVGYRQMSTRKQRVFVAAYRRLFENAATYVGRYGSVPEEVK